MTITAQGLGAPALASPGIGYQQGFGPGFPAPIGAEQFSGVGPHYGTQDLYGRPVTSQIMPQQVQQVVSQLTGQILPVAQQIILPQVIALAVQLVQQQVHQLMTQVTVPLVAGQYPVATPQWQLPFSGQPSAFWPAVRPYAGLS